MKNLIALLVGLLTLAFANVAVAKSPNINGTAAPTAIRTTAIITTSEVLSTTITVPYNAKALVVYADFTKGSATNAILTPCGANDNGTAGYIAPTAYYQNAAYAATYTASGAYLLRVPIEAFGSNVSVGIRTLGTGTMTSSDMLLSYKWEYD
jgi:ABC-type Fe3+-hydroxamate transport system substrate-binding protein